MQRFYYISAVFGAVILAGFFSGTETGVYRLSRFRLRVQVERKDQLARILASVLKDSQGLIFSMLIGTNLSHYLATSFATYIFLSTAEFAGQAEFYATLLMTPVLFIFSEIIPKNLYMSRSNEMMPGLSPLLWFFYKLFTITGAVFLLKQLSKLMSYLIHSPVGATTAIKDVRTHQIRQIFHETSEEDLLSSTQSKLIGRVVEIPGLRLSQVMVPFSRIVSVEISTSRNELLEILRKCEFNKLPVYVSSKTNITGCIDILGVLSGDEDFTNLHNYVREIPAFSAEMTVLDALNVMRKNHNDMAVVNRTSVQGKTVVAGIITIKDLVEEITGELI